MTPSVRNEVLTPIALLVVGLTNIIGGSVLSGLVPSFTRSESDEGATAIR